jgi:hypothetical protein
MSELTAKTFWSTVFFQRDWDDHSRHAPELIRFLLERQAAATERIVSGVARAAKSGLFESDFNLFDTDENALKALKS